VSWRLIILFTSFFFFQAEDGIRDFHVTGVQTCALPILQISISGSGYNIVEYRRKGILKRLFVTPIRPAQFIGGLVLSRSLICLKIGRASCRERVSDRVLAEA